MKERLRLPNNYTIDESCIKILKDHLCDYIIHQAKDYLDNGINMFLTIPMKVVYNGHHYWVSIVKDKEIGNYYWYMRGYQIDNFITDANDIESFRHVIKVILERKA